MVDRSENVASQSAAATAATAAEKKTGRKGRESASPRSGRSQSAKGDAPTRERVESAIADLASVRVKGESAAKSLARRANAAAFLAAVGELPGDKVRHLQWAPADVGLAVDTDTPPTIGVRVVARAFAGDGRTGFWTGAEIRRAFGKTFRRRR